MRHRLFFCLLVIVFIFGTHNAGARPHQALNSIDALDKQIEATLAYLSTGKIDHARLLARQLAWRFPDFALGQLIHAELEAVSAFKDVSIADHMPVGQTVSELLLEAQRRLNATPKIATSTDLSAKDAQKSQLPGNLVQAGKHLTHLVVADLESSVLYQYQVNQQHSTLVRSHYIGSGEGGFGKRLEGDLKTPLGVYTINGFLSDSSLPDLYGSGALTLDYPNVLDQHLGRTGYGIWLHGVPSAQRSRSPYSSEGCVTMSNQHLERLATELDASSTRVILTNTAAELDETYRNTLTEQFHRLFERYQQAWMSGNEKQLMSLYTDHQYLRLKLDSNNNAFREVADTVSDSSRTSQTFTQTLFKQAFGQVQAEDVSIFLNPDLTRTSESQPARIIIDAIFGPASEYQITTYWSQNENGDWRVLTESISDSGL